MKKTFTLICLLFLIAPFYLFAGNISVLCSWENNDLKVNHFRYRLDNGTSWVVIPSTTKNVELTNLDSDMDHHFYLEQSYDGQVWKKSGVIVIESLSNQEFKDTVILPTPVVEPKVVVATNEIKVKATVSAKVETPVTESSVIKEEKVEQPMKVEKERKIENNYYTSILLLGGGDYSPSGTWNTSVSSSNKAVTAGLEVGFNNLYRIGTNYGVGLSLTTEYVMIPKVGLKTFLTDLIKFNYQAEGNLRVGLSPSIEAKFGFFKMKASPFVDVTLVDLPYVGVANIPPTFSKVAVGGGARLDLGFDFGSFEVGLRGAARYFGNNLALSATALAGFNF